MKKIPGNIVVSALLLVIVVSLIVRFLFLDADPPLFFQNTSQDLLTDPYNVTASARHKALFDSWDLFDYHRWEAFKYSLSSAWAYVFFKLGGVSRTSANLSAVILSSLSLLLFIAVLYKSSRRGAAIAAVLLLTNAFLIIYGRYPFLENGLLFLSVLLSAVFIIYYPHKWSIVAAAILTSLCVLSGKAYGIVMAVPVMAVIIIEHRSRWFIDIGLYIFSGILSGIILAWLYYGSHYDVVYFYMSEQSTGLYGFPQALTSVIVFFEQLVSFGGQSRFYYLSPFLLLLLFVAMLTLLLRDVNLFDLLKNNRALAFCLLWFLVAFLFLMVFNHRPLRYRMFLMPPLCGLIGLVFAREFPGEIRRPNVFRLIGILLLCWHLAVQLIFLVYSSTVTTEQHLHISMFGLIPGAILAALIYFFNRHIFIFVNYKSIVPMMLIILAVFYQGIWLYDWFSHRIYALKRANIDIAQILAPEAVVMGPYSQALTIDNRLKSFTYMFGLTKVERDLFTGFPFTHVATDAANWERAVRLSPDLNKLESETRYWVREFSIDIYRLPEKDRDYSYHRTDFEAGRGFLYSIFPESTAYYVYRFLERYPDNISGLTLLSDYYLITGQITKGLSVMDEIIALHPDDYSLYIESGFKYYKVYLLTGRPEILSKADSLFERAIDLNPLAEETVVDAKMQAAQMVEPAN
jgi:4-amino-4-deoxy-L-arabinose transferase-like glycosyltransferase